MAVALALSALAAGAQQVTLPLGKYEELRARANPAPETAPVPPAPFALEVADFAVQAGATSARLVQTLVLTLYGEEWRTVPLGEAGSFIAADFGGMEGRVEAKEGGWVLQVRGSGRHKVVLESVVPVKREEAATRPTWRFTWRLPAAAVVRGRIEAPAAVEEVELEGPGLIRREGAAWSFVTAPEANLTVKLSGKATLPERARLPLRFESTTATATRLSRTRLTVFGWIEARVAQGRLTELTVPIPGGVKVVSATGPIAGWNVVGGPTGEKLVITPLEPVEGSLAVEVEMAGDPRTSFAAPLLLPEGSARTSLLAKAALRGDGLLTLADPGAARAPEERETARLPESVGKANGRLFAVADAARPPRWEAEWADKAQVLAAQVDRLLVDVAVGDAGRASYQVWAEVRNRGAQQLGFSLPPGFELVGASRDGAPVTAGLSGSALEVPLLSSETPQVVHVVGVVALAIPQGKGDLAVPLPALSAPAARVEVRVLLPGGRSYALADATRAGGVMQPPRAASRAAANEVAQRVMAAKSSAAPAGVALFFSRPPGFAEVLASWSALSNSPAPLVLKVDAEKEKVEWF
jgi:hypothetical protein